MATLQHTEGRNGPLRVGSCLLQSINLGCGRSYSFLIRDKDTGENRGYTLMLNHTEAVNAANFIFECEAQDKLGDEPNAELIK